MASFTKYSSQVIAGGLLIIALLCLVPITGSGEVPDHKDLLYAALSCISVRGCFQDLPLAKIQGGVDLPNWGKGTRVVKVGSRPPRCTVDKCLNCSPCMATLIAPIHQGKNKISVASSEHDTYYLLAWKCKCGNKIYQP